MAATKLRALPLPQRLYYDQTVYRAGPAHSGGNRELPQCGVELIGAAGMKADLEMVATAVDALRVCGASRFHVELGHAGFFRDVAARMELEEGDGADAGPDRGQNFAALRDMLAPFRENPASAALLRLSRLFGGPEVLDEAEALAGETEAVEYLPRPCTGNCLRRDTARWSALTWGWSTDRLLYWRGLPGLCGGAGDAVLSGGRYDSLVGYSAGRLGHRLCRRCGRYGPAPLPEAAHRWTLWSTTPPATWPRRWRWWTAGPGTCELSPFRTLESSCNLAREKGAKTGAGL